MEETIEKMEELYSVCAGIYNIVTRSDWTNGEIYELVGYEDELHNAIIGVSNTNAINKFNDLAKNTTIFQRRDFLPKTKSAFDLFSAWIRGLKSCEFGTQSDLFSRIMITCLVEFFSESLSEIRFTIRQIKILQGEEGETNDEEV